MENTPIIYRGRDVHYLPTNELIAFPHQNQVPLATINATLARTFSSPLLYAVYLRLINSKGTTFPFPITVNLAAPSTATSSGMLDQIELVVLQSLKEQDRSALWSLSPLSMIVKDIIPLTNRSAPIWHLKQYFLDLGRNTQTLLDY